MMRCACVALGLAFATARAPVVHPWESGPGVSPFKDGAYVGPFLQLTDTFLNTSNPADNFGAEDKLVSCTVGSVHKLVFIDLDVVRPFTV
jgi:hypothetical protein